MFTSATGKRFLNAYNNKYGTAYDARTFFVEKFYPLFFDHNKYMMTAGNSPLENPKLSWDDMIKGKKPYETAEQRDKRYHKFMEKADAGYADAGIARGFPSLDENATTSGQVTDLVLPMASDEIFLSWLGDGLGVGVQGGLSILFDKDEILLDIFEGWTHYRNMLNATDMLKGNQINTWNGNWLANYYGRNYDECDPTNGIEPNGQTSKETLSLDTQSWTRILIAIASKFPDEVLTGYVYSIGQTNTTAGMIPFALKQIARPQELYVKYFGMKHGRDAEKLWGTAMGFRTACTNGAIGVEAMEPNGLRKYMGNNPALPPRPKDEKQEIEFNVYKIWILAMLNNDELWSRSERLAALLKEASTDKNKPLSTKNNNLVENLLKSANKKQFMTALADVITFFDGEEKQDIMEIAKTVNVMPSDNAPYFMALLRLNYRAM